ncbi:4-hydroxybutyrate coenzyme A transferase [Tritrichomonas foetus]|uniref:4-hydroxybutyrate coenzyme A transferase n=1 Tax=Tritrichomonas foetus TaxID=1144522 RepID=A0A1J4J844_9EUKA|nr:4-hydroxybutyrate coenzyme A transferase [Tritrichomonas foetus]|eukprot:OHS93581.1 4-hydroxybutyrate coenzyme A transferase [Tritrichomonas foetus]
MLHQLSSFNRFFRRARVPFPPKGFTPIPGKYPIMCKTALEAVSIIKSNTRVFIHEIAATPQDLIDALCQRAPELRNVELTGIFPIKNGSKTEPLQDYPESFTTNHHFIGPYDRHAFAKTEPHPCFIPMYLHEVSQHLRAPDYPIDVGMISLSPPNKHGWCSLGPSICIGKAGFEGSKVIVAEINPNIPRTLGNTFVHISHVDYAFETNRKLPQYPLQQPTEEQAAIGRNIAGIIPDGACLQAGIGGVPDATLLLLKNHKNLGIHTEMFAEGLIDLIESGAVTGSKKGTHIGQITASFVLGSDRLYNYIDDNPLFYFAPAEYTNNPYNISQNPNMYAINSALEVDLTGQINADTFGSRQFSGVGGQVDFTRGANMSEGGKAIIALPSTAKNGTMSRIVPCLTQGSSVTTTRWEGCVVATEFGIADLWGLNTRQRAKALINIAHPKFQEELDKKAFEFYGK